MSYEQHCLDASFSAANVRDGLVGFYANLPTTDCCSSCCYRLDDRLHRILAVCTRFLRTSISPIRVSLSAILAPARCQPIPRCWVLCWRLCAAWYAFWLFFCLPMLCIYMPFLIALRGMPLLPYVYLWLVAYLPHIYLSLLIYLSLRGAHLEAQLARIRLN